MDINKYMSFKDSYKIAVIGGAGHIGLPLSLVLAASGNKVIIIDIDESNFKKIKSGKFPFKENGGEKLLKQIIKKNNLILSTSNSDVKNCDFVFLTIGTPVDKHSNPNVEIVLDTIRGFQKFLKKNSVLVLRSTLFPGTTDIITEIFKKSKIKCGVSFCPERVAQGKSIEEIYELPQLISSDNLSTQKKVNKLFKKFNKNIINLTFKEAELAKLFSNAWRNIKFSVANQFYMFSTEKEINFNNVRNAMIKDYPRNKDFPEPGFTAGPCLVKDTLQTSAYNLNHNSLLLDSVRINESLPSFLVSKLENIIEIKKINIGILGMAFKKNIDDARDSLSFKLKKILEMKGANVLCSDPYIKMKNLKSANEVLKKCEYVFIPVMHDEYLKLNFEKNKVIDFS